MEVFKGARRHLKHCYVTLVLEIIGDRHFCDLFLCTGWVVDCRVKANCPHVRLRRGAYCGGLSKRS